MAAPSATVWGATVGDYCRLGIYKNISSNNTTTTATIEVWFWSKYSCTDTNNTLYYDNRASAGSATTSQGAVSIGTTYNSGEGWSTTNQVKLKTYTTTYTRGTSATTRYLYAKLANVDKVSNVAIYASTTFTVPALTTYTVSYNANNGSGAPTSQTKYYGKTLTLSTVKPTRSGYAFKGWATSASGSVAYASGASYTANANVTLYAVWQANTWTVSYNANGGTGAPASQTKQLNSNLTLSSTKPTRANYKFVGWATSPSATTATYQAGGTYTNNASVTLYAVWELTLYPPKITNLKLSRFGDDSQVPDDRGSNLFLTCDYEVCPDHGEGLIDPINIQLSPADTGGETDLWCWGGGIDFDCTPKTENSGSIELVWWSEGFDPDTTYDLTITFFDPVYYDGNEEICTTISTVLEGTRFAFDAKAGGKGVAFGKNAELEGIAEFAFDAKFNKPVYGNVMGLNRLPDIPSGSDLNNYMNTGAWAIYSNAIAATITCGGKLLGSDDTVPPAKAGRFEVSAATGEGIRAAEWSYLRHKFIPYQTTFPVYERDISRDGDNNWTYYAWHKTTLSAELSDLLYKGAKILWGGDMTTGMYMTDGHTATLTENVSEQPNGIVLVFCYYNGTSDTNWGWIARFVPKLLVALEPGDGHIFELTNGKFGSVGTKYLYISDSQIKGHADNNATGTAGSGITYANNKFVLRYVLGV